MIRKATIILTAVVLMIAVSAGIVSALDTHQGATVKTNLANVRAFAPASHATGLTYAVDAGELYAGHPGEWRKIELPANVIAGAVAVDSARPNVVYVGAANEMAVYRGEGRPVVWMRVPLGEDLVGGVTSLAVDSLNRLVYAGTDTAGIFRLRDVGSSVIAGGHLPLSEPVEELATDSTGAGLAFARTSMNLYRAENLGLSWSKVANLGSTPTALAVANRYPATVYVGTTDRGLLASTDGQTWTPTNDGLGLVPGSRLQVTALAIDPAQLDVVYAATSYLYGTTSVHQSPATVAMSTDGGATWGKLNEGLSSAVVQLLPVPDATGAVYALTNASRQPQALGTAPIFAEPIVATEAPVSSPVTVPDDVAVWMIAALAAIVLALGVRSELRRRTVRQTASKPAVQPAKVARQGR